MDTEPGSLRSPRLTALQCDLDTGNTAALAAFWHACMEHGTPLVEPIAEDASHCLVTFVWQATEPINNVVLMSDLVTNLHWSDSLAGSVLVQLGDTDLYYRTFWLRADARFTYRFSLNQRLPDPRNWSAYSAGWRPDPTNPRRFIFPADEHDFGSSESIVSVLELPAAPPQPWITQHAAVPSGVVSLHRLHSTVLRNEHRLWVYTPPGYPHSGEPYPFLLLFDGWSYLRLLSAATTLDNLIAGRRIPPLVAVLLESPNRNQVLSLYPPFLDFLRQELDSWVHTRYQVTRDPARRTVGGLSLGGLTAMYTGLRRSDLFGNVLSQSGGVFWAPGDDPEPVWLAREFARTATLPLQFYLDVGLLEREATWHGGPSQVAAHRHLRDVLQAKGYPLHYHEYNGDHHFVCWRGTLADGLIALMPAPA